MVGHCCKNLLNKIENAETEDCTVALSAFALIFYVIDTAASVQMLLQDIELMPSGLCLRIVSSDDLNSESFLREKLRWLTSMFDLEMLLKVCWLHATIG